jgi:trehalose 6-phosphate synthase
MPKEERISRWRTMKANVDREDVHWWRTRFTDALMAPPLRTAEQVSSESA